MSTYRLDTTQFTRDNDDIQAILAQAHQARQRPLCLCQEAGVPMVIAKIEDHYLLKRMPNSGTAHAFDCESFECPPGLSGRAQMEDSALKTEDETGLTSLKLDFALSKSNVQRAAPSGTTSEKTEIKADPHKMSLRALLHCLYEDARLTHWRPAMQGKRNWYIVRKYLLGAASDKLAKRNPLSDKLLIPERFEADHKDAQFQARRDFLTRFYSKKDQPVGILIGEVKSLEEARFGHKLVIKHMPELPLFLNEKTARQLTKHFDRELAFFEEDEQIHLLVIATFTVSASGALQAQALSLMLTDRNWLPFESRDDKALIEQLVSQQRPFVRMLRYDLPATTPIATLLLTDMNPPVAVFRELDNPVDQDAIEALSLQGAFNPYTWSPGHDLPTPEPA